MSEILIEHVGVSPYAPVTIDTYQYNGVSGLTFGQLIMAVCCRRGAAIESQSVVKMNTLTSTTAWLEAISAVAEQIFSASSLDVKADIADSGYTCGNAPAEPTLREFLNLECGISSNDLYSGAGTYDERMRVFSKLKQPIDSAASQSEQQAIELQSLVSRRDATYNMSAATVRSLTQSSLTMAAAMR